jgi:hypothetical protein
MMGIVLVVLALTDRWRHRPYYLSRQRSSTVECNDCDAGRLLEGIRRLSVSFFCGNRRVRDQTFYNWRGCLRVWKSMRRLSPGGSIELVPSRPMDPLRRASAKPASMIEDNLVI